MLKVLTEPTTWILIGSIVVIVSGFMESKKSSKQKEKFERELRVKSEQLQAKTEMVAKLSIENAKHSAEQNEFIIKSFVGGNSYCYLSFSNYGNGLILPIIKHEGKYPLYDINFSLMDLDLWDVKAKLNDNVMLGDSPKYYDIGNLGPGAMKPLQPFRMQERELVRLKANISARNGVFIEMIHARRINKLWHFGIEVFRFHDNKTLFEDISKSFPRDENGNY
ncbi:MAG: hypothetical protein QQN41_11080, partial [Nitrosopumilus sp.]